MKTIALVAHDARKEELLDWVKFNAFILNEHKLVCTGTTGKLVRQALFKSTFQHYEINDELYNYEVCNELLSNDLNHLYANNKNRYFVKVDSIIRDYPYEKGDNKYFDAVANEYIHVD